MLSDEAIDELLQPVFDALRSAMREASSRGYAAGSQAAVQAILHNATALLPVQPSLIGGRSADYAKPAADVIQSSHIAMSDSVEAEVVRRAPRGLVDEILDQVLRAKPGMTQEEVESAVGEVDSRVAIKSVYNKLRAWEKQGRRFRRHRGLWYRIQDIPPPWEGQSSPQGETGGVEPPISDDDLLG